MAGSGAEHVNLLKKTLVSAFQDSALPGENIGFDAAACAEAVHFVLDTGMTRIAGRSNLALESISNDD